MRALLPLLAVAAALPAAPPALLVLRAACRLADPAVFDEARFMRHAAARPGPLPRALNILNYENTCGPEWNIRVIRSALSVLGNGGGILCVGWPGADVCEALSAATRALRRAGPSVCAKPAARGQVVAHLAVRLGWRRVLVPPAEPRSECAAALREMARALSAAGPAVRRAPLSAEELARQPHVVILCASRASGSTRQPGVKFGDVGAGPAVLLLDIEDLESQHRTAPNLPTPTDVIEDVFPMSNINLVVRQSFNLQNKKNLTDETLSHRVPARYISGSLFSEKFFLAGMRGNTANERRKRRAFSMESVRPQTNVRYTKESIRVRRYRENDSSQEKNLQIKNPSNFRSRRIPSTDHTREPHPSDGFDNDNYLDPSVDAALLRRALLLTDYRLNEDLFDVNDINIYDAALEASDKEIAAESARIEFGKFEFYLYEGSNTSWLHAAIMTTDSVRSLDSAEDWDTVVELRNATMTLDRWGAPGLGELDQMESAAALYALAACAVLVLMLTAALTARWAATRRRRRKRRGDAVLSPAEFTFPVDERRRVGEGMETMLSCWLQQLHEFGGPELERPDLLKQPPCVAPRAPSAPSSTCSVNRVAVDRRIRFKGDVVHVKYLPVTGALELKRKATDVLLVMQNMRHENLNSFIGCLCELRAAFVFDHCWRGSLEDVLMADEIKLDWTFRLSLLTDLVKGMRHLHASPLRVHGRLSSRNCVVDSRWVLRITDYGLPSFYRAQGLPQPLRTARELLWTAPELLRESRGSGRGTQPGDVFSFAIIMQEVIVRGEPYCMLALTPDEIVDKVSRPPPLIRPSVSMGAAPPEAVSVMRQCWSEAPDLRPDFHRLHDIFRHLHRGRKINIVDSMFEMLEKYSNNLEELIKERTEQLDMEKKKTEQLLNRMLPRSVAERLMLGSRVEPEEFEEVSIYFSDIVGFTALAARSTPVQVVDLLNDLYTTFDAAIEQYRVYKVETIGDAYMVVGGLPVRTRDHAESVATMALHLLHLAGRLRVRHLPDTPLHLRIGLHTGPCCAGVVGLTMPRYCLFGDTVNTASRMESTGAAWRIQVSAATAERLAAAGGYRLRSRGLTQIKGKGAMHTYWLLGKDGFEKPLPTPPPLESEEVLFETDAENESETSSAPTSTPVKTPRDVERQGFDSSITADKHAWQKSGAVSADSSPPRGARASRDRARDSQDTRNAPAPTGGDHSAPYARYRCLGGARRPLRRQWSLERGDAAAAAAAGAGAEPRSAPASPREPRALLPGAGAGAAAPPAASRYRMRPVP